jgi:hypothetical protein
MSLRDDLKAKLRAPAKGGWKELIQNKPGVQQCVIEIIGDTLGQGAVNAKGEAPDNLVAFLDRILQKKQHINDLDLLLLLDEVE